MKEKLKHYFKAVAEDPKKMVLDALVASVSGGLLGMFFSANPNVFFPVAGTLMVGIIVFDILEPCKSMRYNSKPPTP